MGVFIAWHNTFHNPKRAAAALAGVTFSVLLVLMQLGFLDSFKRLCVRVYDYLDFDLIIISEQYENLDNAGVFDKVRLMQAKSVPGVAAIMPLNVGRSHWTDPDTDKESTLMILGIDPDPEFVKNGVVRSQLSKIARPNAVLLDELSHRYFGKIAVGRKAEIDDLTVEVAGLYNLGLGIYREGSILTSNANYYRLMGMNNRIISMGLVKLGPGADPRAVEKGLRAALPDDVRVLGKAELMDQEQAYFISVKPVGIMFRVGAIVAVLVGGVILFQVLSADISHRLDEFATLKALGFSGRRIYGIGMRQALIFASLSYGLGLPLAWLIFWIGRLVSKLPLMITWQTAFLVGAITFAVCLLSGVLALQKVKRADPAELY